MKKLIYINPIIFIDYIRKMEPSRKRTADEADEADEAELDGYTIKELLQVLDEFLENEENEENEEWHRLCEDDEALIRKEKEFEAIAFMDDILGTGLCLWSTYWNRDKCLKRNHNARNYSFHSLWKI